MDSTTATDRDHQALDQTRDQALDQARLDAFEQQGYLVIEDAFDPAEFLAMRREADVLLELVVNASIATGRTSTRLNLSMTSDGAHQHVRRIQPLNDLSLLFTATAADARLVTPLRQLLGGAPSLMEEKITYKEPLPRPIEGLRCETHDDRFAIHSDWGYYKDQGFPRQLVNAAICLDDCTPDNGPLHVWPGSHTKDYEHEQTPFGRQVLPHLIDFDGGVDVLARAGSIIFFHAMLVHNSRANPGPGPRRLLIFSYALGDGTMRADIRNGPARLRESPFEWQYQRMLRSGEYRDRFQAPVFDA
jgi:ectoine hydroxylase-related dioxygenase (phytanoyl-CoA dioxygenase family)